MRKIPPKLREEMANDPYYLTCARLNITCKGRLTWEHAWIYAGRQINEKWAIIPLCEYHHLYEGFDKHENQRLALKRATPEDLAKYPKKDWAKEKIWLSSK